VPLAATSLFHCIDIGRGWTEQLVDHEWEAAGSLGPVDPTGAPWHPRRSRRGARTSADAPERRRLAAANTLTNQESEYKTNIRLLVNVLEPARGLEPRTC
jgi:hypothetical protein